MRVTISVEAYLITIYWISMSINRAKGNIFIDTEEMSDNDIKRE